MKIQFVYPLPSHIPCKKGYGFMVMLSEISLTITMKPYPFLHGIWEGKGYKNGIFTKRWYFCVYLKPIKTSWNFGDFSLRTLEALTKTSFFVVLIANPGGLGTELSGWTLKCVDWKLHGITFRNLFHRQNHYKNPFQVRLPQRSVLISLSPGYLDRGKGYYLYL